MLSIVASVFDPLGFIAPITITGMMLFQNANRLKVGWQQLLPMGLQVKWNSWIQTLQDASTIHIPRCIQPKLFDDSYAE